MVLVKPERQARLEDYPQRHGQDTSAALDQVLGTCLALEQQDFNAVLDGISCGYRDVEAGRTRPATDFLADLRRKFNFAGLRLPPKRLDQFRSVAQQRITPRCAAEPTVQSLPSTHPTRHPDRNGSVYSSRTYWWSRNTGPVAMPYPL